MAQNNPRVLEMTLTAGATWYQFTNTSTNSTEFSDNKKKNFMIDVRTAAAFDIGFSTDGVTQPTTYHTMHQNQGMTTLNSLITGVVSKGASNIWLRTAAPDVGILLITDESN